MQSVILEQIEIMNGLGGLIWFNEFKPDQFLCVWCGSRALYQELKFCSYTYPREHHEGVSSQ